MTEADWNACIDPQAMLDCLRHESKLSGRKARLFAVAVCCRIWPLLTDERSRKAVEVAEQQADGLATHEELVAACQAAASAWGAAQYAADAAASVGDQNVVYPTMLAADAAAYATDEQTEDDRHAEAAAQAALLRDLIGPFRTAAFDPTCLTDTVVRLAEAAYGRREMPSGHLDRQRLGMLADALEEAGCHDVALLGHLRDQHAVHVRGCHIVDRIIGKA